MTAPSTAARRSPATEAGSGPRRRWIPVAIVAAIVLTRPVMILLALADLPPLWQHDGWHFYTGGDEIEYVRLASSLADGRPIASNRTLGYPLLLTPAVVVTGARTARDVEPWIVLVQAMAGGAAATWLVWRLARQVTRAPGPAAAAAFVFAIFPYWFLLRTLWPPVHYEALSGWNISYQLGLAPYSDVASQVFQIGVFVLLLEAGRSWKRAAAAGACAGFAGMIRITNLPPLIPLAGYPALAAAFSTDDEGSRATARVLPRRGRVTRSLPAVAAFLAAAAVVFSPQLLYNAWFFGSPLEWGYHVLGGDRAAAHHLDPGLALLRWARFFSPGAGALWRAIVIAAFARLLWSCRRVETLAVIWGTLAYTTLLFAYPLLTEDPFRLAMPLVPFVAVALGALAWWIGDVGYRAGRRLAGPAAARAARSDRSA